MADPITAGLEIGSKLIDRLWPDPAQRDAAKLELLRLHESGDLARMSAQVEVNKVEAASASVFVSGWRPYVGWVCGQGLAIQFIVAPLATWAAALAGKSIVFPPLDLETLLTLLGGLLGLGSLRTVEKLQGRARL